MRRKESRRMNKGRRRKRRRRRREGGRGKGWGGSRGGKGRRRRGGGGRGGWGEEEEKEGGGGEEEEEEREEETGGEEDRKVLRRGVEEEKLIGEDNDALLSVTYELVLNLALAPSRVWMEHLLQLKCAHTPLNQRILSSTSVPFTLTTLQVPNLALTHTKRFTVWGRKRRKLSCVFDLLIFFINYMFRILASFLVIRPSTNHIDLSFIKRKAFVLPSLHDMRGAQLLRIRDVYASEKDVVNGVLLVAHSWINLPLLVQSFLG